MHLTTNTYYRKTAHGHYTRTQFIFMEDFQNDIQNLGDLERLKLVMKLYPTKN